MPLASKQQIQVTYWHKDSLLLPVYFQYACIMLVCVCSDVVSFP